jgi:hypothetical protein
MPGANYPRVRDELALASLPGLLLARLLPISTLLYEQLGRCGCWNFDSRHSDGVAALIFCLWPSSVWVSFSPSLFFKRGRLKLVLSVLCRVVPGPFHHLELDSRGFLSSTRSNSLLFVQASRISQHSPRNLDINSQALV